MSLHVAMLIARGDARDALPQLCKQVGCAMEEAPLAIGARFDEVWRGANNKYAVTHISGWTVVWGRSDLFSPSLEYIAKAEYPELYQTADYLEPGLRAFSSNREVYFSITEATSGSYGFDLYIDGERRRSIWESGARIIRDEGALLPEESEFRSRRKANEWTTIEFICHATVPYEVLTKCPVDIRRIKWVPPTLPRWWSRLWKKLRDR